MASVKVVLYTSKTLKNGEHPIMLRIIKDRKIKYISIGKSCSEKMWDKKNNLPVRKHPLYKEMVILIEKKKLDADKTILGIETEDKEYSVDELKGMLKTTISRKMTVFNFFDELVKRLEHSDRIGYANVFKSTKNSLVKFRSGKDFAFTDINISFLNRYEDAFYHRGVSPNSVFVFMRTFKTLLSYARKEKLIKPDFDPFKGIDFTKFRRIKTKKRAITKEQIKAIADLKFVPESNLFHSRNYFLFSYYNRGINFIDMANLKWENLNLKLGRLEYTRRKTKEHFTIGMLVPALEIVSYYSEIYYESKNSYVFPILNKTHKTAKSIDYRIDRMLKIVNDDLKTIAVKAGIDEILTTYVARHSYATNMKRSGISTTLISEALGHESEKTTQIYLDSFENAVLDKASEAIL